MNRFIKIVLINMVFINLTLYSQKIILSNNVYLQKFGRMSYMGDTKDHHLYLSDKQGKHSYMLIRFNKSDMKIYDKRTLYFNNKFEDIDKSLYLNDTLYISTIEQHRNEDLTYKYYKINVLDLATESSDFKTLLPKGINPTNNINIVNYNSEFEFSSFKLYDYGEYNRIYSNDTFYTEHEEEKDTSDKLFKKIYSNVKLVNVLNKKEKIIQLDADKLILRYIINYVNGGYKIIGKYKSKTKTGVQYGIFYKLLDNNLTEIGKTSYLNLYEKNKTNLNTQEKNSLHILRTYMDMKEKYISSKGEITYVYFYPFEVRYITTGQYTNISTANAMNEINLITFDNNGKIITNYIPLQQESYTFKNSVGFICNQSNDKLTFVFFDHKNNIIKPINDKNIKKLEFNNKGLLAKCTFDLDKKTLSNKEIVANKKAFKQFFDIYYLLKNEKNAFYTIKPKWDGRNIYALKLIFE